MATREIKYGNDFFHDIMVEGSKVKFKSTYWDLWISIALKNTFNNDINKMINYIDSEKYTYHKINAEGVINHINLLNKSLSDKNMFIIDIIVDVDKYFIKKQKVKSQRKILEMRFKDQEKSTWMINTPRKLRKEQAMRGHWKNFPVNPSIYSSPLECCYKSS